MSKKVMKIVNLLILLLILLSMVRCGKNDSPEKTLKQYIQFVEEKKPDEAYALLDTDNLPEKEMFDESIKNQQEIKSSKILKSKKVDENTYKFLTKIKIDKDLENESVFVLVKKNGTWFISLNTDPSKIIEF